MKHQPRRLLRPQPKKIRRAKGWENRIPPHLLVPSSEKNAWGFLAGAMACAPHAFANVDDIMDVTPATGVDIAKRPERPDTHCTHSLAWEHLSDNGRYVAELIVDTPPEAEPVLMPGNRNNPNKNTIRRWLTRIGWDTEQIDRTFDELRQFANSLDD